MKIELKYYKNTDSIYLRFSEQKGAYSKRLDTERTIDFSKDGEIRGIQFFSASSGINTEGLPHRSAIERALSEKGISRLIKRQGDNRLSGDIHRNAHASLEALWRAQVQAGLAAFMGTGLAVLIFISSAALSVWLTRNMFVLTSLPGMLASLFGLVVALFPTVLGCLILLAWVFYACTQDSRA